MRGRQHDCPEPPPEDARAIEEIKRIFRDMAGIELVVTAIKPKASSHGRD
jgi:hypothetical protein